MSVLTKAIRDCLPPVSIGEDGAISIQVAFPKEFIGFNGHFPGKPVLPGVCLVQAAVVALSMARPEPVSLKRLVSAKWLAPVLPGERLAFAIMGGGCLVNGNRSLLPHKAAGGEALSVKVKVTRGADKVAEFSIEVGVP